MLKGHRGSRKKVGESALKLAQIRDSIHSVKVAEDSPGLTEGKKHFAG